MEELDRIVKELYAFAEDDKTLLFAPRCVEVWGRKPMFFLAPYTRASCIRQELEHQRRDAATIQRLETAWSLAYLHGDVDLERCLLTADFTEIMSDGTIQHLDEELALAAKNKGKEVTNPNLPSVTVLLHGVVAVAYGISPGSPADSKKEKKCFADYYVWEDGSWRVYFAQQTSLPVRAEELGSRASIGILSHKIRATLLRNGPIL